MTSDESHGDPEHRVLVLAPIGRDADLTRQLLERASIPCVICLSVSMLTETLDSSGAGALLLTEEALDDPYVSTLVTSLEQQPPWSDVPVLLFAGGPGGSMAAGAVQALETLRNVTLLERPIRVAAVLSTVRAALRSRNRQYEVRDLLVALHRARSEAEAANRSKDEFLATLSHELRTPLNVVRGRVSMLASARDADSIRKAADAIARNSAVLERLVEDLLDVSRLSRGQLRLQCEPVDLAAICSAVTLTVQSAADAKGLSLELHVPSDLPVLWADPTRLQQVIWNLLSNAIKFTPAAGRVTLTAWVEEPSVVVRVTDTGVGIPPDVLPHIFQTFWQGDNIPHGAVRGLGLGLSIVRSLVELHGGAIHAESPGLGRGTTFVVTLPTAKPRRKPERHVAQEEIPQDPVPPAANR